LGEELEVGHEVGALLVGLGAQEVLAAGVVAVLLGAHLEGVGEVDGPFEFAGLLAEHGLDADDLGQGDGVKQGALVHLGEGNDVDGEDDPSWLP
jgi:hypothetical protein